MVVVMGSLGSAGPAMIKGKAKDRRRSPSSEDHWAERDRRRCKTDGLIEILEEMNASRESNAGYQCGGV